MMDDLEGSKQSGTFTTSPGRDLHGELTLAGPKTSLYLRDKDFFSTDFIPDHCLRGVLHDLTKVTLIDCISPGPGTAYYGAESYNFAEIFPHYVIYGDQHISPDEKKITEIQFVVDDASTLFYDFDVFGVVIEARQFIEPIISAREKAFNREIKRGPDPQILYFTGKREIFTAETVLGRIGASHNPLPNLGGPNGVRLDNRIFVTITFTEELVFHESIFRAHTLLRYLGILAGRPQNILSLSLRIKHDAKGPGILQVYWSMPPRRDQSKERESSHPADVLLDAVDETEQFSRVLAAWLDREKSCHDARMRFSSSFAEQRHYDINRLIGSANMFDILPSAAVPRDVTLTDELKAAEECSRKIFRNLPQSPERDSVLNALGRVGKSSLKQKIRHRAEFVLAATGSLFDELLVVTDEAVNCRNHYVHGSKPSFDYNENFEAVRFFVDTLEFVFAASDLVEAGWDVKAWSAKPTGMSHPFGAYRISYGKHLRNLKALLT